MHTIYSALILTDVLYFVLIYTKKGLFQWPSIEEGEFLLYIMLKMLREQIILNPKLDSVVLQPQKPPGHTGIAFMAWGCSFAGAL